MPAFKSAFSAAAMGMVSSGWLWLVRDQTGRLGIVPTFGAGTVLVQDRIQRGSRDFQASVEQSVARVSGSTSASGPGVAPGTAAAAEGGVAGGARAFSTSARQLADVPLTGVANAFSRAGPGGASAAAAATARGKAAVGQQLTPLFVCSLQEHAWLPDYGMWGKEMYLMNFWECLDWNKIGKAYDLYNQGMSRY